MELPNLYGIVKEADVRTKGQGNYKASYVPWAKVSALLLQHAPGFHFELKKNHQGQPWFEAPDGTAYLVGYFTTPDDSATPEVVYSVMDHRNNPIKVEKVSSRILTDSERRCMCLVAARTFGLAGELWANDPIEGDYTDATTTAPLPETPSKPKVKATGKKTVATGGEDSPLPVNERDYLLAEMQRLQKDMPDDFQALLLEFSTTFNTGKTPVSKAIQQRKHATFLDSFGIRYNA